MNETKCPHAGVKMRADLPPLPERMRKLPIGKNGYPIPFFVAEVNGSREDFRIADSDKKRCCIKTRSCWVCGEPLGRNLAFVIGPMCSINRLSADPPAHLECALYSVKSCPFLLRPNMVRREDEMSEQMSKNVGGVMLKRNPGVMALWVTRSFKIEYSNRDALFRLGNPEEITWWREGRTATRAEILASIDSGYPLLVETCRSQKDLAALERAKREALRLLPEAA